MPLKELNELFNLPTESPPLQTPCKFCGTTTNRTYRDTRNQNIYTNLISSCAKCAALQNSKQTANHLKISLILKPVKYKNYDAIFRQELTEQNLANQANPYMEHRNDNN